MHELCRLSFDIFRKPWLITSTSPEPLNETWLKNVPTNLPYIEESYFLLCNVWIRNNHDNVRPLVIIMICEEKLERCWCRLCEKISKLAKYVTRVVYFLLNTRYMNTAWFTIKDACYRFYKVTSWTSKVQ